MATRISIRRLRENSREEKGGMAAILVANGRGRTMNYRRWVEFWHGSVAPRTDAFAEKYRFDGKKEDFQVEPETPCLHIAHVPLELLVPAKRVPPHHLNQPCHARPHLVTPRLPLA